MPVHDGAYFDPDFRAPLTCACDVVSQKPSVGGTEAFDMLDIGRARDLYSTWRCTKSS